jgi:hypothetical protein
VLSELLTSEFKFEIMQRQHKLQQHNCCSAAAPWQGIDLLNLLEGMEKQKEGDDASN